MFFLSADCMMWAEYSLVNDLKGESHGQKLLPSKTRRGTPTGNFPRAGKPPYARRSQTGAAQPEAGAKTRPAACDHCDRVLSYPRLPLATGESSSPWTHAPNETLPAVLLLTGARQTRIGKPRCGFLISLAESSAARSSSNFHTPLRIVYAGWVPRIT